MPIKSARPCKGWIQGLRQICCCKYNDALIWFKSIHLNQQLIECLLCVAFPLLSTTSYSINLINENNAGSLAPNK
jgi:hypothetical protein